MSLPEPGPALDARVAEALGTPWMKPTHGTCCTCQDCGWPHDQCKCGYSTDIAAAWEVGRCALLGVLDG